MNRGRQFRALVWKNYLLHIRSRFLFLGWAGLIFQILLPVAFFGVMLIPRSLDKPQHLGLQQRRYVDLDARDWAGLKPYTGAGWARNNTAHVILAPNTAAVQKVSRIMAQAAACPKATPKAKRKPTWGSFYSFFRVDTNETDCQVYARCIANPTCYSPLLKDQIKVADNEEAAVQLASSNPDAVDAVIAFQSEDLLTYTIRLNHSEVPSPLEVYHIMEPTPPMAFQHYWFFVNLQHVLNRALLGLHAGNGSTPADVSIKYHMFPWPAVTLEWTGQQLSRAFATIALVLLLVFAFFIPSRLVVASIVHEKELRLREGMRILGLEEFAYWSSWLLTHWSVMAASGLLAAIVGKFVFTHSSIIIMTTFYWLLALSLVSFSYLVSTFFTASRVAGTAQMLIYTVCMIPGFLLHGLRPYGDTSWYVACLLPPSAASMFGWLVLHLETGGQGATFATFTTSLTFRHPFSVATVFGFLILDIFLYGALAWYFDKILPGEGPRYPPWFIFQASYWRDKLGVHGPDLNADALQEEGSELLDALLQQPHVDGEEPSRVAVRLVNLQKVFYSAAGVKTVAVNNLSLDVYRGKITGLLGHNGAGKTTTISILTGILRPTSGTAYIKGLDIRYHMEAIRQNLGICPQFDLLWPNLTVKEHLTVYAEIKRLSKAEVEEVVIAAVEEVGLTEKMDTVAEDLSGGQRRKLSVAIAFLGNPAVVFLDEPTSGMDPYSRRFTWDIIRRRRHDTAIILTTHSMEEADILCDTIHIMSEGQLAASGTPFELKVQYGMGYTLTLVTAPAAQAQSNNTGFEGDTPFITGGVAQEAQKQLVELVKKHVPSAQLLTAAGAELSLRLPKADSQLFPALLRELQQSKEELGMSSYGLSMTTLEEVFLRVTSQHAARSSVAEDGAYVPPNLQPHHPDSRTTNQSALDVEVGRDMERRDRLKRVTGAQLMFQRWWALFIKRVLSARRDRLAVLTQLAVPLLLVYVSIWVSRFSLSVLDSAPLHLTRRHCMMNFPAAVSVSQAVRNASGTDLEAFMTAWPRSKILDTGLNKTWTNIFKTPSNDSLEGLLLKRWYLGHPVYDAVHIEAPLPSPAEFAAGAPVSMFLATNATAVAALPALLNQVSSSLLRYVLAGTNSSSDLGYKPSKSPSGLNVYSHPLPVLPFEQKAQTSKQESSLVLVMCFASFGAVLSASFVVFLVREVDSNSKHVQLVSGTPGLMFWVGNYTADIILYSVPAACTVLMLLFFNEEPFKGPQLQAVAALVAVFGACSLPLTYFLHLPFKDEMLALQRLNQLFFVTGYLGFIVTLIFDSVDAVFGLDPWAKVTNAIIKTILSTASPHYSFVQGIFDITQTSPMYSRFSPRRKPVTSPWSWDAFGRATARLATQGAIYSLLLLAIDLGWFQLLSRKVWLGITGKPHGQQTAPSSSSPPVVAEVPLSPATSRARPLIPGSDDSAVGYEYTAARTADNDTAGRPVRADSTSVQLGEEEDVDVMHHRLSLQTGVDVDSYKVLLRGVEKSYWLGVLRPRVKAVRGLWLGIPSGECFGLLGVNGAGKTSTFRMLTGEIQPDAGELHVCGHSVLDNVWTVRAQIGYCPQFSGLPLALTGKEVLYMYARIRGIPEQQIKALVDGLLSRLGLSQYANLECGAYSGGNKRKLAVAVALVGDPSVVLMDEPSTGMDPGARRFLWGLVQKEVIARGHTVVLTSHSMEECEALSTRIGIMVGGQFRCLGTTQHLKNRFGAGYMLEVSLSESSSEAQEAVLQMLRSACAQVAVTEVEPGRMLFSIPQQHADLADIFSAIETQREQLGILDYSLSQTTLEQVFVTLAKEHGPQDERRVGLVRMT